MDAQAPPSAASRWAARAARNMGSGSSARKKAYAKPSYAAWRSKACFLTLLNLAPCIVC